MIQEQRKTELSTALGVKYVLNIVLSKKNDL